MRTTRSARYGPRSPFARSPKRKASSFGSGSPPARRSSLSRPGRKRGETLATGDVVNTAARLEAAAPVNGILVSEKTFEATKAAIEYAEAAPIEAKGKAEAPGCMGGRRLRGAPIGADRPHSSPFVGRTRELELWLERSPAPARSGSPARHTRRGSGHRQVQASPRALAGDRRTTTAFWLRGRCLPYGDGVTFWALGEIVKAYLGCLETDSPRASEPKLARQSRMSGCERTSASRRARRRASAGEDDRACGGLRCLAAASRGCWPQSGRTVLVFEDLHWADDAPARLPGRADRVDERSPAARRLYRPARSCSSRGRRGAVESRTHSRSRSHRSRTTTRRVCSPACSDALSWTRSRRRRC